LVTNLQAMTLSMSNLYFISGKNPKKGDLPQLVKPTIIEFILT
jgi:hypothetical protein